LLEASDTWNGNFQECRNFMNRQQAAPWLGGISHSCQRAAQGRQ
jgi:hypothetical protein